MSFQIHKNQNEIGFVLESSRPFDESLKELGTYMTTTRECQIASGRIRPFTRQSSKSWCLITAYMPCLENNTPSAIIEGHIHATEGLTKRFPSQINLSPGTQLRFKRPLLDEYNLPRLLRKYRLFELVDDGSCPEMVLKAVEPEDEASRFIQYRKSCEDHDDCDFDDQTKASTESTGSIPSGVSEENAKLQKKNSELEQKLQMMEKEQKEQRDSIEKMEEEKTQLSAQISRLESLWQTEMGGLKQDFQNLERKWTKEKTKRNQFQTHLRTKTVAMSNLEKSYEEEKIQQEELKNQLDEKTTALQEMGVHVQSLQQQNQQLQKTTKTLEQKLNRLRRETPVNASASANERISTPGQVAPKLIAKVFKISARVTKDNQH